MPMLGKKPFSLVKGLTGIVPGEEVYTILHTQEQFRSKEDYEKRLELYKQEIWTCQCTGHTTLTHEEAWKSEKAAFKTLKSQFPECFEKPVLLIVHHSTASLDSLNDQAWTKIHQMLAIGENVNFKVNSCSKTLKGTVVGISSEASTTSNCNSPSSDKENSSEADEKDQSPKKRAAPKFLPYKYSVRLEDGPVINSVPVLDLARCERPPSKDLVRLFIRSYAVRSGNQSTSPWVVQEDLVKKYALPSKFADFLLSPSKMAEAAKRAEEVSKKRKRQTQDGVASKKAKLTDSADKKKAKDKNKLTPVSLNKKVKSPNKASKNSDAEKQKKAVKKGETTPKKKSPQKKVEVIEVDDSSDDEISLAKIKMKCVDGDSDSDVPLSSLADQQMPKKKKLSLGSKNGSPNKKPKSPKTPKSKKSGDAKSPGTPKTKKSPSKDKKTPTKRKRQDSSDSDVPLAKLTVPGTPKKSPAKMMKEKNEQTPKKKPQEKTQEKSSEKRGRGRPRKGEEKSPKKPGKKGMKQMTLLDLAKKEGKSEGKSPACTPKKSPTKPPATPLIVRKLLALNKSEDKVKFRMLLTKAVMVLTPTQKKNLPSPLKEKVQKKTELMEEKKALDKMSESEREEYLKAKKKKQKQQMKEKMQAKLKEMRKRYEDQDLNLQPLPAPKLVATPENLPNELFGDVAMVTEFITSYSGLLMSESDYPIYTDALMKALAGGPQGFAYLSRVLSTLLQTLLQDAIAEGYRELCVKLRDIAVNPYTVSELVRLCLRTADTEENRSDEEDAVEDSEVPDELIQQLETQEFFQLDCREKLVLLRGLCLRIMATYSVQDYMEEKQREAIQLTKQRNTEMKDFQEKRKGKKQQKGEDKTASANTSVNGDLSSQDNSPAVTITSFYGKKPEDSPANDSAADSQGEDGDLVSIVKRRRLLAARAAAEKEKRDLERRLLREKEFEEERERRERDQFETKFKDSILLARTVLRHTPIGYDRHHNRYWMFTNTTPGIYIEKGWVSQDISYNPGGVPDESGDADKTAAPSGSTPAVSPTKSPGTPGRINLKRKKALVESTFPHGGQNLWFTYTSLKDLDALLKTLHPQGIRESALKTEVKKRYNDIVKAIQAAQRNNLELRDSDGHVEMVAGFKKELAEFELRLRNGGLGGVQNYSAWEAKLMSAEDIATMASCMLEMQENIMDKFLQGFMKLPRKSDDADDDQDDDNKQEMEEGEENEEASAKEDKKLSAAEKRLQQWNDAVESCQTLSRLHVLLSMVDSCIKWEKSAENAKCKICRKKGDDDRLLLCDECNQAFHMYCLRPALINVPRGDWFCPACVPQSKRRNPAPKRFADESESEEDSEEEEMERNTTCEECGGDAGEGEDEQLVNCHKCPCVYHLTCHEPPLRRMPRGLWECNNCKNGISRRNKKRPARKAAPKKNYRDDSGTEDSEPTPEPNRSRSSSTRRSGRTSTGETTSSSRSMRTSNDRFEDVPQQRSRRAPSDLSMCEDILKRLMKHPSCWPFLEPVDKKEVPDYHQIIKKPMDFQTMLKKCGRLSYSSPQEFVDDAILVFSNAATYNVPNSEVYNCMRDAEQLFGELLTKYLPSYASTQLPLLDSGDNAVSARNRRGRRN